jgi:isoquinoline 1-oxidoreductase alpha subunit
MGGSSMPFVINVNGADRSVQLPGDMPLLWVLRDELGLLGTKYGCGIAQCGACTVHLDGVAARSCSIPLEAVGPAKVTTIEAIGKTPVGAALQQAWVEHDVMQCGYCQAGQIMTAAALLAQNPKLTRAGAAKAMNGNICRCGCYNRIGDAIAAVAQKLGTDRHGAA